jgi:hypothetical protein
MKTITTVILLVLLLVMLLVLLLVVFSAVAHSAPPILVDRKTGRYLGNLSTNQYDPDSVGNPYGRYGSPYSEDSINNPYGKYGSSSSNDSPNNPYATNPPIIIDQSDYD